MKKMLIDYKNGRISLYEILEHIKKLPYEDLGFAKIDTHRDIRKGFSSGQRFHPQFSAICKKAGTTLAEDVYRKHY